MLWFEWNKSGDSKDERTPKFWKVPWLHLLICAYSIYDTVSWDTWISYKLIYGVEFGLMFPSLPSQVLIQISPTEKYYALQLWYCCCGVPLSNQTRAIYILRSFEISVYSLGFLSLCTEFDLKSLRDDPLLCCQLLNSPDVSNMILPSEVVIPWNSMISLQRILHNYYAWYWRLYPGSLWCVWLLFPQWS